METSELGNGNALSVPAAPSTVLGGTVAVASLLHAALPNSVDDVFALVPHHTIFSPIATLPLPFLWNLLTAHLFEASLLRAILLVPAITFMAQRLERLWSWKALFLYLGFSCVASSVVVLAWEVVEVFRTVDEKDFFAGTRGCSGLVVALSVGLRHAYPLEVLPLIPKTWGLQCQHVPFCIVSGYTVLGLLAPKIFPEWPFAPLALVAAWFYLRYLMWFSHAKAYGDHSPDFVFANLFPQVLRPVVAAVGALAHNVAASVAPSLQIRLPEEERREAITYDPSHAKDGAVLWNMAGAMSLSSASSSLPWPSPPSGAAPLPGAPGSKEYDARRAKALKLLDESISSLLAPSAAPESEAAAVEASEPETRGAGEASSEEAEAPV